MKTSKTPRLDFETHFATVYGERWLALRAALLADAVKTKLANPFGLQDYALDPASLHPVQWLDVQPGQKIADFCASPGGKSLAMIFRLKGEAEFYCNDLSPARVTRLRSVLYDCVPEKILARVHVSRSDASRWGLRRAGEFDRILLDAPCSGERHLLAAPAELARWSLKGSKRLSIRQHALLCSAFDCLRVGGRLVYSTCSISPLENDGVIEKLLHSRKGQVRVIPIEEEDGEALVHGRIYLPDRGGAGPIYACALERTD